MAERFVDGDLLRGTAPFDFARQDLANLSDDVVVTD
jgi:hypothetical protein